MTVLTDYDSTIAVRGEWFICANTGEFVMRSETCSGRFDFTVRAGTLYGSHILTHPLTVPLSFNYHTNRNGNTKYTAKLWAMHGILGEIT